jgi:hypothetical protein
VIPALLTMSTAPENSKMAATQTACRIVSALAPTEGPKELATSCEANRGGDMGEGEGREHRQQGGVECAHKKGRTGI